MVTGGRPDDDRPDADRGDARARPTGDEIAASLGMEPLPEEGGLYREIHRDEHSTAIYYLLIAPEFSALHQLPGAEVFHFYAGDPATMLLLHPDGRVERPTLGPDPTTGHRPQVVVPGGTWQGMASDGAWTLMGATMAPGFRPEDFRLATAAQLLDDWVDAADDIRRLTRG